MANPKLSRSNRPLTDSDPRHCLMLFPRFAAAGHSDHWWLYAIGFHGGFVKVGYTANPRTRILQQWFQGQSVEWVHLGPRFQSYAAALLAERAAHEECRRIGEPAFGNETFTGLTRADAIQAMRATSDASRMQAGISA